VASRFKYKLVQSFRQWRRNRSFVLIVSGLVLFVGMSLYTVHMSHQRLAVDPSSYSQLLQLIARVESNGNYNAYFGNARNTSIDFTAMSIAEVMAWQADFVKRGNASSAVGRYQIIDTTLAGLVRQLGIDTNRKFNQATQDEMAIALLERRGTTSYVNKELTVDQLAASLAKEWASLPKVIGQNPDESYYASDGLNKSLVSVDEVRRAIQPIRPK